MSANWNTLTTMERNESVKELMEGSVYLVHKDYLDKNIYHYIMLSRVLLKKVFYHSYISGSTRRRINQENRCVACLTYDILICRCYLSLMDKQLLTQFLWYWKILLKFPFDIHNFITSCLILKVNGTYHDLVNGGYLFTKQFAERTMNV